MSAGGECASVRFAGRPPESRRGAATTVRRVRTGRRPRPNFRAPWASDVVEVLVRVLSGGLTRNLLAPPSQPPTHSSSSPSPSRLRHAICIRHSVQLSSTLSANGVDSTRRKCEVSPFNKQTTRPTCLLTLLTLSILTVESALNNSLVRPEFIWDYTINSHFLFELTNKIEILLIDSINRRILSILISSYQLIDSTVRPRFKYIHIYK